MLIFTFSGFEDLFQTGPFHTTEKLVPSTSKCETRLKFHNMQSELMENSKTETLQNL